MALLAFHQDQAHGENMIREVTGVEHIERLYLQLHYACNYRCQHCFHGEMLESGASLTSADVESLAEYFRSQYGSSVAILLGGEPLLHLEFASIVRTLRRVGYSVEVVTNGHFGLVRRHESTLPEIDFLRVSIDGLEATHDDLRQPGSWRRALETLEHARLLGVTTGVTTTVNSGNIREIPGLATEVAALGVSELKLHHLRLVGNAAQRPWLAVSDEAALRDLIAWARSPRSDGLHVVWDDDLDPDHAPHLAPSGSRAIDRIEVAPSGELTMSCKAVGTGASAFTWSRRHADVQYHPSTHDEVTLQIEDVQYVS